jgi:MAPEG family
MKGFEGNLAAFSLQFILTNLDPTCRNGAAGSIFTCEPKALYNQEYLIAVHVDVFRIGTGTCEARRPQASPGVLGRKGRVCRYADAVWRRRYGCWTRLNCKRLTRSRAISLIGLPARTFFRGKFPSKGLVGRQASTAHLRLPSSPHFEATLKVCAPPASPNSKRVVETTPTTVWCAALFFWLRVAHAIGMISGKARLPLRPLLFTSGWLVTMTMVWQLLSLAVRV